MGRSTPMKPYLWTTLRSRIYSSKRTILWIILAACMVRFPFLWLKSGDYLDYLHPWFEQIKQNGGVHSIGLPVGNYMVSYIYLLALLTYLPLSDLFSIKLVSITGDVVLAWFCMKLAGKVAPNAVQPEMTYGIILFLPTVVLNSSAWGQCDSLYTAALLAFLYFLSEEDSNRAVVSLSIAFCLKLQTVFLAPIVLIAVCQRIIRIRSLVFFPLIYGLTIFPAYCAGRPLMELITLYLHQAYTYSSLSMNAPNLYAWLPWQYENKLLEILGIFFAGVFTVGLAFLTVRYKINLAGINLLKLAFLSALIIPFLLPHMHERYFYLADILSLLLVLTKATKHRIVLWVPLCSLCLTARFLFGLSWISPAVLSIFMSAVCVGSFKSFYQQIQQTRASLISSSALKRGDFVEMR